ncbi:MAG: hypothetical protein AAGA48_32555 [Myxococcota bacterium]
MWASVFLASCSAPVEPADLSTFCTPEASSLPPVEDGADLSPYDPAVFTQLGHEPLVSLPNPSAPRRLWSSRGAYAVRVLDLLHKGYAQGWRHVHVAVGVPSPRPERFAYPALAELWAEVPQIERRTWLDERFLEAGCAPHDDVTVCSSLDDVATWVQTCRKATSPQAVTLLQFERILANGSAGWVADLPIDLLRERDRPPISVPEMTHWRNTEWQSVVPHLREADGPVWPTLGLRSMANCERAREAFARNGAAWTSEAVEPYVGQMDRALTDFGGRMGGGPTVAVQTENENQWIGTPEVQPHFSLSDASFRYEATPVGCSVYSLTNAGPQRGQLRYVNGPQTVRVTRAGLFVAKKTVDLSWWPFRTGIPLITLRHTFEAEIRAHLARRIKRLPPGSERLAALKDLVFLGGFDTAVELAKSVRFTPDERAYTKKGYPGDYIVPGQTTILAPLPLQVRFNTDELPVTKLPFVHGRTWLRYGRVTLPGKGIGHLTLRSSRASFEDALLTFEPDKVLVLGDHHPFPHDMDGSNTGCVVTDIEMDQRCQEASRPPAVGDILSAHTVCYGRDQGWFPGVLRSRHDDRTLTTILMAPDVVQVTWDGDRWQAWFSERSCDERYDTDSL